ncbi:MAG: thioesterase family protein [Myxococcales bacterium]|nr:thioesterase family protein [Myxococcales bacterium]
MAVQESAESKALESTLRRLDVDAQGEDLFVGTSSRFGGPRLFGGLVAGQAVVAAARTVEGPQLHSLHAYFLRPGSPKAPVEYSVERLKEGKNFHARSVVGRQEGSVIFTLTASFAQPEKGFAHQDPMPDVPDPDTLRGGGPWGAFSPVLMRDCDGGFERSAEHGQRRMWMRPTAALPEDPVLHLGMLVFVSDMSLVMTGVLPHPELRRRPRGGASLDHSMWFHRITPFDDWMLYTMETPAAHAGRPLIHGAMYRRDGTRVVSVAQEGLIRTRAR